MRETDCQTLFERLEPALTSNRNWAVHNTEAPRFIGRKMSGDEAPPRSPTPERADAPEGDRGGSPDRGRDRSRSPPPRGRDRNRLGRRVVRHMCIGRLNVVTRRVRGFGGLRRRRGELSRLDPRLLRRRLRRRPRRALLLLRHGAPRRVRGCVGRSWRPRKTGDASFVF